MYTAVFQDGGWKDRAKWIKRSLLNLTSLGGIGGIISWELFHEPLDMSDTQEGHEAGGYTFGNQLKQ